MGTHLSSGASPGVITPTPEVVLSAIPVGLRTPLLAAFDSIIGNYRAGRWEPSALNGGKFSECVYSILVGYTNGGAYAAGPSKPSDMVSACRALEKAGASIPRSVRIQIPRMLIALYEIRNNRGAGHVGGDVDPNRMDAAVVVAMARWILAELVRVFHATDTATATVIVDGLVDRDIPVIWSSGAVKRVLQPGLSKSDQTLILLHSVNGEVPETTLRAWVEHSNPSVYRRDILRKLHSRRLIEYDQAAGSVRLTALGARFVEDHLPLEATPAAR